MRRVTISVSTNKVGSTCEYDFDVDDDEFDGMSDAEINDYMLECLWQSGMIDWTYDVSDVE